ncbi:MAG TPA: DHA2 family efflux MFS transporter permease subunit [Steroidobacteraceae bacterium]|jgi:DHA2 family multidrug resistance protein|nr:DHA2 family efflux MFS transporter permease subunit [Steroidobacteraceae bacterium]
MSAAWPAARAGVHPWLVAPVVALAAFMEVLDISVANVALPHIAGDLSVSRDESTWILTSYLVANAIIMPITGWLAARFGRKRLFLTCIAAFTIVSLLCGLAPSLPALVILRALQGAAGGGLQPTGQAILNDAFPREKQGMATAVYGVAVVMAPAIGPSLGGWITDNYDWRWVFLINVPVGALLLFLIGALVKTPNEAPSAQRSGVDWTGFWLVAASLGCLQIALDRGQEYDWFASGMITTLCVVSAISFVFLIWWELQHASPMVNLRLLKRRNFAVSFFLMFMLGFMIFGTTYLLPAFAQYVMGYQATQAGELLMPGGLLLMALFPFVGRILNRVDLRLLIGIGIVLAAMALLWMTNFYEGVSFGTVALGRVYQYVGLAFLFLPINALGFGDIPAGQTNYGSALINLARNFGGSVGVAFTSTLVTRRMQFHQSHLVGHLQPLDPAYPGFLRQLGQATHAAPGSAATLAHVSQIVQQQASLLSYLDGFKALAVAFLLLLPVLFLARPGTAAARAPT